MSEPKRINLVTLSSSASSCIASNNNNNHKAAAAASAVPSASLAASSSGSNNNVFATPNRATKTLRIDLDLFEPSASAFPEFNYSRLIRVEKKIKKKIANLNGSADPFEDNDDDVTRIAKEMERKYGSAYSGKSKGGPAAAADCYDKGAGYDENDDFIDNTEAYDENVPDEIDTDRGGFYINSGSLVFKPLANFERPEDAQRMPKPRKRVLSSSSDSSVEADSSKVHSTAGGSAKSGHIDKKIKPASKKDDAGANSDSSKDAKKSKMVKTTTVKDMLRAKRDSLRNMAEGGGSAVSSADEDSVSGSSDESDSDEEDERGMDDEHETVDENSKIKTKEAPNSTSKNGAASDVPQLPINLPVDLVSNINRLTYSAKTSVCGISNFFDSANTELLYQIDIASRAVSGAVRNCVYNYLEHFLPCTKQTMQMRAKKCRIQREEAKTGRVVKRLKFAVDSMLPELQATYETECQRITELRAEAEKSGESQDAVALLKMPKRRFVWNHVTRLLNWEVFESRRQSFEVIKPRKETLDAFVQRYVREHVLKLWPEGYVRIEDLIREFERHNSNKATLPKKTKEKKLEAAVLNNNNKAVVASVETGASTALSVADAKQPKETLKKATSIQSTVVAKTSTVLDSNTASSISTFPPHSQSESFAQARSPSNSTHSTTPTPPPPLAQSPSRPPSASAPSSSASQQNHTLLAATSNDTRLPAPLPAAAVDLIVAHEAPMKNEDTSPVPPSSPPPQPSSNALPSNHKAIIEELSSESSSSSDDVEFVSEMPMVDRRPPTPPLPSKPIKRIKPGPLCVQVNRQKYMQQRANDLSNGGTTSGEATPRSYESKVSSEKQSSIVVDDPVGQDLDVNQIMRDLKELQPLPITNKHQSNSKLLPSPAARPASLLHRRQSMAVGGDPLSNGTTFGPSPATGGPQQKTH